MATSAEAKMPPPLDLSHHFSETTKHRFPSKMKQYYKIFQIPGIGQLAGGLPNVNFFPFDTLEAQTAKPERWTPSPNHPPTDASDTSGTAQLADLKVSDPSATPKHITVPKALPSDSDRLQRIDLATALQYGQAQGYPPLIEWVRQFTLRHLHPNIPYAGGADVTLTVGSTDGMAKTLDLFVDPWSPEKDDVRNRPGMVCETYVYANAISQAKPKGVQIVPVVADEDGMCADGKGGLEDVLGNWDEKKGRRPHLYYTVSMGHNPTGIVMSLERRKAIYAVCSKYDVIVIEDDPYWYLQFPSAEAEEAKSRERYGLSHSQLKTPRNPKQPVPRIDGQKSSGYDFLDSMTPSFLSVDTDGRVVRLDTFSKTVAPGCRLGWITAQPALIERFIRIAESSTQQPSGFVQSLIAELVMGPATSSSHITSPPSSYLPWRVSSSASRPDPNASTGWKMDGWIRWLEGLRGMYERRMVRMCRIFDEGAFQIKTGTRHPTSSSTSATVGADSDAVLITKTRLYDFSWPRGGMFIWLRMYLEHHPLFHAFASDGSHLIDGTALATGLLIYLTRKPYLIAISPGMMFASSEETAKREGWGWFRICFAAEAEDKIDECSGRFVEGVHGFWKVKKVEELEELLKEVPGGEDEKAVVGGDDVNLGMHMC